MMFKLLKELFIGISKNIVYKKLYKEIEKLPLCYDDGFTDNEDDMEFTRGEAHFKEHILILLKEKTK